MASTSGQEAPQASSSTSSVPTLPTFPDLTTLWSQPGPSSLFILQEAQAHLTQIKDLRRDIISNPSRYTLGNGPSLSSLPPLPPIPNPAAIHISSASSSSALGSDIRPDERPSIPLSLKGKGKDTSVGDTLKVFEVMHPGWRGEERYSGRAVLCYFDPKAPKAEEKQKNKGSEGTAIWAMINQDGNLGSVKVYLTISGDVPDISSPGFHTGLSHHLTALSLSLPELLYRIPHLAGLVRQACFYCSRYIKVPDGMPVQHTGYLAAEPGNALPAGRKGSEKSGDKLEMSVVESTSGSESEKQIQEDKGEEEGRWVCWHASCGKQ